MKLKSIVVADDTEETRRFIVQVLISAGYDVASCGNAAVLAKLAKTAPDLIIMDALHDDAQALELAHELSKRLKVLWSSAMLPSPPGADAFPKPFGAPDLVRKVREMLHDNFD